MMKFARLFCLVACTIVITSCPSRRAPEQRNASQESTPAPNEQAPQDQAPPVDALPVLRRAVAALSHESSRIDARVVSTTRAATRYLAERVLPNTRHTKIVSAASTSETVSTPGRHWSRNENGQWTSQQTGMSTGMATADGLLSALLEAGHGTMSEAHVHTLDGESLTVLRLHWTTSATYGIEAAEWNGSISIDAQGRARTLSIARTGTASAQIEATIEYGTGIQIRIPPQ